MKSAILILLPTGCLALLLLLPGCKPEELGEARPTTDDFYNPPGTVVAEPRMPYAYSKDEAEVKAKSEGCMTCHKGIENPSMHLRKINLGCTDCHGGNAACTIKEQAHVQPRGNWYNQTPSETAPRKLFPGQRPLKDPNEKKPTAAKADEPNAVFMAYNDSKVASINKESVAINVSARPGEAAANSKDKEGDAKPKEVADGNGAAPALAPVAAEIIVEDTGHGHSAANPRRSNAAWLMESPEFVRFVNPGDLRVARYSCGTPTSNCHAGYTEKSSHSMMAHGAMLWNAALYNNGASNQKVAHYGEAYTFDGEPARLITKGWKPEMAERGILPYLDPLLRYNISQPGNILRAFERGGKIKPEIGVPNKEQDSGKPEMKLSTRGIGTELSTDPVFLGLQKTRLLDPTLWELGTNDQAGDYRSSGCTACHTIYANDRDPAHSGPYAKYGKDGQSFTKDAALQSIVGRENGHPIQHTLTRAIPSSQCIVCHMHPGTTVTMTYYGNLWWDNETEGSKMYPKCQEKKTERDMLKIKVRNVEGAALRGKWGDVDFLESAADMNPDMKLQQFADYNGHGWIYRNVYKRDKKGNLLDKDDKIIQWDSPNVFKKGCNGEPISGSAVHMQDIHQEKGMHCVDCHFSQDNHGDGNLYGEVRNAVEITCQDCHGSIRKRAEQKFLLGSGDNVESQLRTTGNAAPQKSKDNQLGGTNLTGGVAQTIYPEGVATKRFQIRPDGTVIQRSAIYKDKEWIVKQVKDTITPGHPDYNERSRLAKTMQRDAKTWGQIPDEKDIALLAHQDDKMDCYVCHTSWMASCFGCHLPMRANQARFNNHYEGAKSRNWTQYNFQTLREDVFMLGLDGKVKGNKIAPVRSTCAVLVASQNANREWIYAQQQTISAEGFSGQAFSPHFPHSVRAKETKHCTDCHLSKEGDNNAQMAQLLMQGTNQTNFMFRYVYTANGSGGLSATVVTEHDEPQAVIGSTLHRDAYPEEYAKHQAHNCELEEGDHHAGTVCGVQLRGEYLYTARGTGGLTIYDVANVDNKGFSEKITTAPVSPLGQRFYVKSKNCTAVVSPTVLGVDPTRQPPLRPRDPKNLEEPISLTYAFLYCTDSEEGLFTVLAGTLLDGDPLNNFLTRHLTFNPGGILNGAVNATVAGNYIYVCCDAGIVIVDISGIGVELVEAAKRLNPDGTKVITMEALQKAACKADPNCLKVVKVIPMNKPKSVRIQFRYAFAVDCEGLKVIDVTDPPEARLIDGALVPFAEAYNVYLSRTYAYVAAGKQGIGIVDIEHAEHPKLDQMYNADGKLCDIRDVKVGMTNTSLFAYAADYTGKLAVLQLTSPETNPNNLGWAPRPNPVLIATRKLPGTPVAISEGLQRDRGVDESGNQLSVFNRVGSRPMKKAEQERLYKIDGKVFMVSNDAPAPSVESDKFGFKISKETQDKLAAQREKIEKECDDPKRKALQAEYYDLLGQAYEEAKSAAISDPRLKEVIAQLKEVNDNLPDARGKKKRDLEQMKEILEAQKAQLKELLDNEQALKTAETPREKSKINKDIMEGTANYEDLRKKYWELKGEPMPSLEPPVKLEDQIKDLEEKINFEKNQARRLQMEKELEELKAKLKK
ncbi:MAG TPA: hypothetical protein VKX17_08250 [Planctomycetota bacterium]|nr:hypothetical protein [Planctomycetota bacterium]